MFSPAFSFEGGQEHKIAMMSKENWERKEPRT